MAQLCRYAYDPLDRLASRTMPASIARDFYRRDRLATQIQGAEHRSFVHHESQLLAQCNVVGKLATTMLTATDAQHSVRNADNTAIAYAPYGHRPRIDLLLGIPGFNGEQPDPVTGHYLLGNGHRAYNPVLMRFNRPDSLSPFGDGGLNPYTYCLGDPINRLDPSGKVSWSFIIGLTLNIAAVVIAVLTTNPSLPFILSVQAANAGFWSASSVSTIVTSVASITGGVIAATRTILAEVVPGSSALEPLGWINLAVGLTAVGTRLGTVVAARNPKNLANIKAAIEQSGKPVFISQTTIEEPSKLASDIRRSGLLEGSGP